MAFVESTFRANDYFSRLEADDEDGNEFTDRWTTCELLCLASAVQRSGDKNWVSVSRSIKLFSELRRPTDWYNPKNCALQYSKLLKGVEDFKKKSLPRTERETSEELLVKNLTDKRLTELSWLNQQTRAQSSALKACMELLENGEYDDHVDDLLQKIEELDAHDEDDFNEWLSRRESLCNSKRLNKRRVPFGTGKAPSRSFESKRKNSPIPDHSEDTGMQEISTDITVKTEVDTEDELTVPTKPFQIKTELDLSPSLNALLDKPTNISAMLPTTPTSPLLTSLLRNVAASSPASQVIGSLTTSPLKESDLSESPEKSKLSAIISELDVGNILKSKETSSRSVSQSPRPAPASSPLLNSLLKNTPSSTTNLPSLQLPHSKDVSLPKAVSSPQSFFNPTSALATAAAQQLAVATSTLPQSHQFFQHDISEGRKSLQSSPINSACLSAPTLSKLLEMPPSTPGRLPPLPIVDTSANSISTTTATITSDAASSHLLAKISETKLEDNNLLGCITPPKKISDKTLELNSASATSPAKTNTSAFSSLDTNAESSTDSSKCALLDSKTFRHGFSPLDVTSQENIDILEAVCESLSQVQEIGEIRQEPMDVDSINALSSFPSQESVQISSPTLKHSIKIEKCMSEDSDISVEKLVSSIDVRVEDNIFASVDLKETSELLLCDDDLPKKLDIESDETASSQNICDDPSNKIIDLEEDNLLGSRKFYKSRTPCRKRIPSEEEVIEKISDSSSPSAVKLTPKKITQSQVIEILKSEEESLAEVVQEAKLEVKSPVAKKPRIFEKVSPAKKELSEDEMPLTRRSGRRTKKGRGKSLLKPSQIKEEPKDQYEFSESTEENSVGYQAANTLCYMPRLKDENRIEESKIKQEPQDINPINMESPTDKKHSNSSSKCKQARTAVPQTLTGRRNLFTSDEERMSDSLTSDEASNPLLGEDKLKQWKDASEKKEFSKDTEDGQKVSQRNTKSAESPKKKHQTKKNLPIKNETSTKKEKKSTCSDIEESSACSRDSEDANSTADPVDKEINIMSVEVETETTDSRMSLSATAESENQIDDVEGCESLPGSVTAEFSPLPVQECKEGKDGTQFGKQDWYHGSSPKSSEPVSQSSEESEEYESDNWDNHSVSTNKSASHSAGQQPRLKRKERESPQYKAWKKAISIVLREASCHKYANVFLQKVTNDVAPGYLSIVNRPMDLSLIKKNIDNGVVKTTDEFHRDMLLMFQNAIMYNSSDHDVHQMAKEMQEDVIQQIEAFLITQRNGKDESADTTSIRAARTAKAQKGYSSAFKSKDETD